MWRLECRTKEKKGRARENLLPKRRWLLKVVVFRGEGKNGEKNENRRVQCEIPADQRFSKKEHVLDLGCMAGSGIQKKGGACGILPALSRRGGSKREVLKVCPIKSSAPGCGSSLKSPAGAKRKKEGELQSEISGQRMQEKLESFPWLKPGEGCPSKGAGDGFWGRRNQKKRQRKREGTRRKPTTQAVAPNTSVFFQVSHFWTMCGSLWRGE